MTTATRIQKWGNSQGVRLPKPLLEALGLAAGDPIEISSSEGEIVIRPARKRRRRHRIADLAARMPRRFVTSEEDWGPAVGREAW